MTFLIYETASSHTNNRLLCLAVQVAIRAPRANSCSGTNEDRNAYGQRVETNSRYR